MGTLLDALLGNESGGKNIANTTQSTSSGQAQGYFQITTGTWDDFGGQQYAPTPLQATYAQQAAVASKIPLGRWDSSTIAAMKATGKPINTRLTLGQNLAMNGENFGTMSLSDYMASKTGHSLGASSPEQAADQANASQSDGGYGLGNLMSTLFGGMGLTSNPGGNSAGGQVGALAPPTKTPVDAGISSISNLASKLGELFTVDFWRNAAAVTALLIFALAFMVFGGYRLINT